MARLLRNTLAVSALAAIGTMSVAAEELCSLKSSSYSTPKHLYPEAMMALDMIEKASIATWYTDRDTSGDYADTVKKLLETCPSSTRLNLVVYGLPNKDCEAGASTGGRNTNRADYEAFIKTLADGVGGRKALYVLEPDAVGLITKEDGCGDRVGYMPNLLKAVELLSSNPNAEIYVDTGYWALEYPESTDRVVHVIKELQLAGHIKGIALNTANYRSTESMAKLCTNFQTAMGSTDLHCIVDTSRNFDNGNGASIEWCNVKSAGIGHPPTDSTGYSNLDYFLWLKPQGESDGQCEGRTADSMAGPAPGEFFYDGFKSLWNQGYYVKELKMPKIGEVAAPTPAPSTPAVTPSPTIFVTPVPTTTQPHVTPSPTTAPVPTTTQPKPTPSPTTTTDAPIWQRPITSTPGAGAGGDDQNPIGRPITHIPCNNHHQHDPSDPSGADGDDGDDESPIQNDPSVLPVTGKPTPAPTQDRPTPAPTQARPTPAVSRFRETSPPVAATALSTEKDSDFGKRLLNGIMIFFVGAVAVLGVVIMINRARTNRLKQAMYYKEDSFCENPVAATPQSVLELSPAHHYRGL